MDNWSDLPEEIVDIILSKIDLPLDVVNFSAISKPWRSTLMEHMYRHHIPIFHFLPKQYPLPMLLVPLADGPEMHHLYSINEHKTYDQLHIPELKNKWICGSSRGWLVTVDTVEKHIHLFNAITRTQVLLPHLSTFDKPVKSFYHREAADCWYVRKANAFFGSLGTIEDCVIVATVSTLNRICFCRFGDEKWTNVYLSPTNVHDFVIYNDLLYFVNGGGTLFSTDTRMGEKVCNVIAYTMELKDPIWISMYYLVESPIGLLLVGRVTQRCEETIEFRVFRLTESRSKPRKIYYTVEAEPGYTRRRDVDVKREWTEMETIGDWMIFVGRNCSICLDSCLYPACKGNCIYFADDDAERDCRRFFFGDPQTHDIGIYDLQEKKVEYFIGNLSVPHHAIWLSPSLGL